MRISQVFTIKVLLTAAVSLAVGSLLFIPGAYLRKDEFQLVLDPSSLSTAQKEIDASDTSYVDSTFKVRQSIFDLKSDKELESHYQMSSTPETQIIPPETQIIPPISDTAIANTLYDPTEYEMLLDESLKPIRNESLKTYSVGFRLFSGFCNQYMYFVGILFYAISNNIQVDQILLESLHWKDTLATSGRVPHSALWDVIHWNSYYPSLPKIVRHNPEDFPEIIVSYEDIQTERRYRERPMIALNLTDGATEINATKPYILAGNNQHPVQQFRTYQRHIGRNQIKNVQRQHGIFQLIAGGALRPHPEIQEMIRIREEALDNNFMALHARIEPDMLVHPICKDKKVNNMTEILQMVYLKYPKPPVKKVLLIFNRPLLEERCNHTSLTENLRVLSQYNLAVMNDIVKNGMWNGTVAVIEGGANMVKDYSVNPLYKRYNSIVGAILNFFIALSSKIFIGTEISSYSVLAVNSRFYRENRENYFYYPDSGLLWMTDQNANLPPRFRC